MTGRRGLRWRLGLAERWLRCVGARWRLHGAAVARVAKATGRSQQSGGRARVCREDGVSTWIGEVGWWTGCTWRGAAKPEAASARCGSDYTSGNDWSEFCGKWQSSGLRRGDGFGARESSGRWEIDTGMHGEGYYRSRRCSTRLKEVEVAGEVG